MPEAAAQEVCDASITMSTATTVQMYQPIRAWIPPRCCGSVLHAHTWQPARCLRCVSGDAACAGKPGAACCAFLVMYRAVEHFGKLVTVYLSVCVGSGVSYSWGSRDSPWVCPPRT
eukprot:5603552-Prymnesium_polylepis.1